VPRKTSVPDQQDTYFAEHRGAWRAWLSEHHASASEVWLLFYKRRSGKRCISLAEAVEERSVSAGSTASSVASMNSATCCAFAPSAAQRVVEDQPGARATTRPRGRMTAAGLAAVKSAKQHGQWQAARQLEETKTPPATSRSARRRPARFAVLRGALPSQRKMYIAWVLAAKRPETRARRVHAVVDRSARGIKPACPEVDSVTAMGTPWTDYATRARCRGIWRPGRSASSIVMSRSPRRLR